MIRLIDITFFLLRTVFRTIIQLFFKDWEVFGDENVPKRGPVIICGNHANQFVDGMMMFACTPRFTSFIIAASSYRKKLTGTIAKLTRAIPVERAQDVAKKGTGKILKMEANKVTGEGTKFTEQSKVGDSLRVPGLEDFVIKEILSDTEVILNTQKQDVHDNLDAAYKILPKLDQNEVYSAVWDRLTRGYSIGIFPEGGSHDRTEMLPIKAGVCIMALGAMAKGCEPITIVPCGLNYFKGHRFRSKVVVEYGAGYTIPKEYGHLYKTNKRQAISSLLSKVEAMMRSVIISVPTHKELLSIHLARKLYVPDREKISRAEEHILTQRIAAGYNKLKNFPQVKLLFDDILKYRHELKRHRLDDSEISRLSSKSWKNILKILISLTKASVSLVLLLPSFLLYGPAAQYVKYQSEKQRRKALANSDVKIMGTDVVASHKIQLSFVVFPVVNTFYTFLFCFLVWFYGFAQGWDILIYTLIFSIAAPVYTFLAVRSRDGLLRHTRIVIARISLFLFGSKVQHLKEVRSKLKEEVKNFVEKYAQSVPDDYTVDDDEPAGEGKDGLKFTKRSSTLVVEDGMDEAFESLDPELF